MTHIRRKTITHVTAATTYIAIVVTVTVTVTITITMDTSFARS